MNSAPFPQRTYTPLCLLSVARSGSNLLRSLLNNHPDVLIHGESFNPSLRARATAPFWHTRPLIPYQNGTFRDYMEQHLFPEDAEGKRIIGFKLFPMQLNNAPEGRDVASHILRTIPGMKMLMLIRENVLDTVLSTHQARMTDVWAVFDAEHIPEEQPYHLSYEQLVIAMNQIHTQHKRAEALAQGCDTLRITYADLIQNTADVMHEVQQWLGLDIRDLQPNSAIRKQRTHLRSDILTNFKELRQQCTEEHPEWLPYFDEPEHLTEVVHHGAKGRLSVVAHPKTQMPVTMEPRPTFYMQLYRDGLLAENALKHLRRAYPLEQVIVQSDGDDNPDFMRLARKFHCDYYQGERLYALEHGGKMLQRMLNSYLSGPGDWLIKIDTDTRIDRRFKHLPEDRAVYGCLLRQGPPQGGCVILPRAVAEELRDSRLFLSPLLKDPAGSWGEPMHKGFLEERISATGCIGFEWTLFWACQKLGIPVLPHPEIHATWKQGHANTDYRFAVVHPDKFIHIKDPAIHRQCTTSHSGASTIFLEAVYRSV
jgi:LPS sulfotransferase NodH